MKVFGIGFHKTGTTSLGAALQCLGYRVHGGVTSDQVSSRAEAKQKIKELSPHYDAFQDMPWPILYEWLDKEYRNSKFVLTVRPKKEWINSVCKHFGNRFIKRHKWIYGKGDPIGNQKKYLKKYENHNKEVVDYFEGRIGDDLLIMEITSGDGWDKLCPFLGDSVPFAPFPKSNMSHEKWQRTSIREKTSVVLRKAAVQVTARFRRGVKKIESWRGTP
jgi:hypothetical protein